MLILETIRDRVKRMKIWDHMGKNGEDDQNFKIFKNFKKNCSGLSQWIQALLFKMQILVFMYSSEFKQGAML